MSSGLNFRLVGVGASAGGLEALERFFASARPEVQAAFLVVQHLSPDHKSLMASLLGKRTQLTVEEAADGVQIQRGHVYVIPPWANLSLDGSRLQLVDRSAPHTINMPIDLLFRALAEQQEVNAVGVILSGTGSDGQSGVEALKAAGGLILVQTPQSARFDGMPLAALAAGVADFILPPEEMLGAIERFSSPRNELPDEASEESLSLIFQAISKASGVDFREYKPATVLRRIERRLGLIGAQNLRSYAGLVNEDPVEALALSRDLLISVTRFFRDAPVWAYLQEQALPALLDQLPPGEQLRAWVAGCATGQEAYSLAISLVEAFEAKQRHPNFKIFATDIDREALEIASRGEYPVASTAELSGERLQRFFQQRGDRLYVEQELRQRVVLAYHNVASDPPFTRLGLISCRNVLIYLSQSLQAKVLASFAFALQPGSMLLLGTSESASDTAGFTSQHQQLKIYQRTHGQRVPLSSLSPHNYQVLRPAQPSDDEQANQLGLRLLVEKSAPTSLLVREDLQVVTVFSNSAKLLEIPSGVASLSLASMLPESVRIIVQTMCTRALSSHEEQAATLPLRDGALSARVLPVQAGRAGRWYLALSLSPQAESLGVLDLPQQQHAIELQRELQQARESLQATIEELETANEELQATNEEMLAANEELQATNEELQSLNEELNTVNAENQTRITELVAANNDLDNAFSSTSLGVLLLDQELRIRRFTPGIAAQFNILGRDVGRPFQHLASPFSDAELLRDIKSIQAGGPNIEREITNNGSRYLLRVTAYINGERQRDGVVLSILDVTQLYTARQERERLQRVLDSLREHIVVINGTGRVEMVNQSWMNFAEQNQAILDRIGVGVSYLHATQDNQEALSGISNILAKKQSSFQHEYPCHAPSEQRWFLMYCSPLRGEEGAVISHIETTELHRAEEAQQELFTLYQSLFSSSRDGILLVDEETQEIHDANPSACTMLRQERPALCGRPLKTLAPLGHENELRTSLSRALREGAAVELTLLRGDTRFTAEMTVGALQRRGRTLWQCVFRDVSERKRLMEALLQSQKLEAVGQLAAGVAHDMNNVLAVVIAASEAMEDLPLPDVGKQTLGELSEAATRGKELVAQLLATTRRGAVQQKTFDLRATIESAARLLQRLLPKTIAIRVERPTAPLYLRGDEGQWHQVLLNLGVNARDAMPNGGTLHLRLVRNESGALLEVIDTGVGMSEEVRQRALEPFFTTKEQGHGTGLGLSMVYNTVTAHGGVFSLESTPHHGTTAQILIPEALLPATTPEPSLNAASPGKVLLVDDEASVRSSVGRLLRMSGYEAVPAGSVEEALQQVREQGPFRIVLCDFSMPGHDGAALVEALTAEEPIERFIIMSGFLSDAIRAKLTALGVRYFLEKPFGRKELLAILRAP